MTEAELNLTLAYLSGFGEDKSDWTPEKHLAGLKAVFRAGAAAGLRDAAAEFQKGADVGIEPTLNLTAAKLLRQRANVLGPDPVGRADVWAEAIDTARQVILRRRGTYEADIDLLALPNPYEGEQ